MANIDTKKIISRILQKNISIEELEEFKKSLNSDPDLKEDFKLELGFFMALKNLDDIELENVIDKILPVRKIAAEYSLALFIRSISEKLNELKKQGGFIGEEIKLEVLRFMTEIKSLSNLKVLLVPLEMEQINLLGSDEKDKSEADKMKYLSHNVKLRFMPPQLFKIEDFKYRYNGKYFYVIYDKKNFKELIHRNVTLITDIGSPFIFTSTFKEKHNNVTAKIKIEFEEIFLREDLSGREENYHDILLNIEE